MNHIVLRSATVAIVIKISNHVLPFTDTDIIIETNCRRVYAFTRHPIATGG